jgi:hypothetical protein
MRIVYIAGRYSCGTLAEVARNVDTARKFALMLAERRIPFVCSSVLKLAGKRTNG